MAGADVEALSRSFRSRVSLLGLLLVGGLAAAVWSGTRDAGIGEPEDRRRLMVVTRDSDINYYAALERAGFQIEVDDYDDWLLAARSAAPESEADGVALLLELADLRGFGLVVFERPSELDFAGLELEPSIDSIDRLAERDYAVASVGDFAFPHRLTVDDPGEDPGAGEGGAKGRAAQGQVAPILRLPGYGALQAVFRQELIGAREDADRPTVEELQFEDAIALGRQMFERPAGFAAQLEGVRAEVEAELADGSGARSLVPTLTTGTAIPTPDGGVLLFEHELVIYSDDARTLELEADAQMRLSWIGPEALAAGLESGEFERTPCTSLAGGVLPLAEPPQITAARDGSVLGIGAAGADTVVWRKLGPGCDWAAIAELETGDGLALAPWREGPVHTVAARIVQTEASGRALAWAMRDEPEAELVGPAVLLEQADRHLASPSFIDDRHLAIVSERYVMTDGDEDSRLLLLDRERPGVYLSVPAGFFAEQRSLGEVVTLAPASADAGPELLISARNIRNGRELIRLGIAADAWAEFLDADTPEPEFGVEGRMVSLTPEQLDAEIWVEVDYLYGFDVAGGSLIYAYAERPNPAELVLMDLETRESRRLTDNDVRDYVPRFGPDARFATFVSLMSVKISTTPFSVPRVLSLPVK